MKTTRAIIWILILAGLLAFSYFNWRPVEVTFWRGMSFKTMLPAVVICSFLLGLLPMWLIHRARKWQFGRRIKSLESEVEAGSTPQQSGAQSNTSSKPHQFPLAGDPASSPTL